ncbi:hypothetical protein UY3_04344 [Chelonia mydas]|uniref:Myb/SANT-like DNA-binding domain-containing protein n=1 Tax=Chelonia mydas TaxID=8469 RepID=M7CCJ4_CHEMY|nr:hypothetical protein UY3_04344 [Chelonia mydas]
MQSSSAEVTMMESQNRKRAPAWTEREVRDLIAVWGEESVLSELRSSFRNAKTFVKTSQGMKDKGHNRDPKQCRVKLKELRQAYQKTREANGRSGSEPQTCRFYDELHAILGGSATTTPVVLFDSFSGDGGNTEAGFEDEEDDDDDDEVQHGSQICKDPATLYSCERSSVNFWGEGYPGIEHMHSLRLPLSSPAHFAMEAGSCEDNTSTVSDVLEQWLSGFDKCPNN